MLRKLTASIVLLTFVTFVAACTSVRTSGEPFFTGPWDGFVTSLEQTLQTGSTMEKTKEFFGGLTPMTQARTKDAIVWTYYFLRSESTKTSKVISEDTKEVGEKYTVVLIFGHDGRLKDPQSYFEKIRESLHEPKATELIKVALIGGTLVFGGIILGKKIEDAVNSATSAALGSH